MAYTTWNVQSISTKRKEISEQLERYQIDIAAFTETKRKVNGYEGLGDYITFFSSVPKHNRAKAGVNTAVHKKLKIYIKCGRK